MLYLRNRFQFGLLLSEVAKRLYDRLGADFDLLNWDRKMMNEFNTSKHNL